MTTSFTTTNEFGTQIGDDFGDEGQYPQAFGITFTPQVSGIAIGVTGLLIAGYLFWTQVLPVWGELSQLRTQKADKQNQLNQLNSSELEVKINQKKAELEATKQIKQQVISLFADEPSLETLLLDVSNFANSSNLKLNSYAPSAEKETITDESFGSLANNNLEVKTYNLDLEGTFAQLQIFLQDIERLKPLLVIQNFNVNAEPQDYLLENNQLVAVGEPKLKSTITVQAVFPNLQPAENGASAEGDKSEAEKK
jgi:hypothetical protein